MVAEVLNGKKAMKVKSDREAARHRGAPMECALPPAYTIEVRLDSADFH